MKNAFLKFLLILFFVFFIYVSNAQAFIEPQYNFKYGKIAVIIDDLGPGIKIAHRFITLPFPLTVAVLPHKTYSVEIATLANEAGKGVILHLPMEPLEGKNSNEVIEQGEIMISMGDDEISKIVEWDLDSVPFISGVNNHKGSKVSQDVRVVEQILDTIKSRGLFFIDSLTSGNSIIYKVSYNKNVKCKKRDIFLDNIDDKKYIKEQLKKLVFLASKNGYAIGIGHDRENTAAVLEEMYPEIRKMGMEFVLLRDLF